MSHFSIHIYIYIDIHTYDKHERERESTHWCVLLDTALFTIDAWASDISPWKKAKEVSTSELYTYVHLHAHSNCMSCTPDKFGGNYDCIHFITVFTIRWRCFLSKWSGLPSGWGELTNTANALKGLGMIFIQKSDELIANQHLAGHAGGYSASECSKPALLS